MKALKKMFISLILVLFTMTIFMPITLFARTRTINTVDSGNELHMSIDSLGFLDWDDVDGATGYVVELTRPNISSLNSWETAESIIPLISYIDQLKYDSGQYTIIVRAKGVAADASMNYYYTSNVDQLEAPNGLMWDGDTAKWNDVSGAYVYNVELVNYDGRVTLQSTNNTSFDFSGFLPEDGWTFKVQAKPEASGTLSAMRDSSFTESPKKGASERNIKTINSGNELHMSIDSLGFLDWDDVDGATGYVVELTQPNITLLNSWETAESIIPLISYIDQLKYSSGQYIIIVSAKGVAADASMNYYYTSNVDQLEAPNGLMWAGETAKWNAVSGAYVYNVELVNYDGRVTLQSTNNTSFDFSGFSPEDGWTFRVQAKPEASGTLSAMRDSSFTESPAYEESVKYTVTYDANGGSGTMSTEYLTVEEGLAKNYTFPTCGFTAPSGKEFDKWEWYYNSNPSSTNETTPGNSPWLSESITVKALWKDKIETVTEFTLASIDLEAPVYGENIELPTVTIESVTPPTLESSTTLDIFWERTDPYIRIDENYINNNSPKFEAGRYTLYIYVENSNGIGDGESYIFDSITINGIEFESAARANTYQGYSHEFEVVAPITYTVTYDANGGSGTMSTEYLTVEEGFAKNYTFPACGFTAPSGKEFDKWEWYYDSNPGSPNETTPGNNPWLSESITVKALWKDKIETVTGFTLTSTDLEAPVYGENIELPTVTIESVTPSTLESSTTLDIFWERNDPYLRINENYINNNSPKFEAGTYTLYIYVENSNGIGDGESYIYDSITINGIEFESAARVNTYQGYSHEFEVIAPTTYTTTVNNGTATPATAVVAGTEVTITANAPETGKEFDKWIVNAGGVTLTSETSATTTFTMGAANVEVTATYKDIIPEGNIVVPTFETQEKGYSDLEYKYITVNLTNTGKLDLENAKLELTGTNADAFETYNIGTVLNGTGTWPNVISVRPKTGLEVGTYSATLTLKYDMNNDRDYETIIGSGELSFTVNELAPTTYTIAVSASPVAGGTVTGAGTYDEGATVTVVATANEGYRFVNWTEGGSEVSTNATYEFEAGTNRTLVAVFELIPTPTYEIATSASPIEGGTVTGAGTYDEGATVTVVATANEGYTFVNWTEGGSEVSTNATYEFEAGANRTLLAVFELIPDPTYTVTFNSNGGSTVASVENVLEGSTIAKPTNPTKSGYTFVGWYKEAELTNEFNFATDTITENTTLFAKWNKKQTTGGGGGGGSATTKYTITVKQSENGTISPETTKVEKGENQKFEIKADKGYEVEKVLVDGKSVGAITEYTFEKVKEKHTIEATFKKVEEVTEETWKNPFTDVDEDDWYYESVKFANENKLFNGVSNTEFGPNVSMTRAMLVTVLYRLEGEPATNKSIPFADVDMSSYYASAVIWAKQNNIVNGIDDTNFAPNGEITREQLATILYRYANYKGIDVSVGENTNILSYDDFSELSEYAIPAMQWACGSGIITGRTISTIAPKGTATRAEVATMLMRFTK